MAADTSCNVKTGNPFFGNVCFVLGPYGCGICSRSFQEVDALFSHALACPWPEPFQCGLCSEPCASWRATRDHLAAHIKRGAEKCPLCGRMYGTYFSTRRHIQREHVSIRPFVCNCCGCAFVKKMDIHQHSRLCRARTQVLEKYLGSSENCDSQARSRLATTVYKCSVCSSAFLDRLVIARHMRVHLIQSRGGEGQKKDPFHCGNHKSYGRRPPKVKHGVKASTQCFIKIEVAHKATYRHAISKATQAELRPSTVSSSTQCDDLEDSEDSF